MNDSTIPDLPKPTPAQIIALRCWVLADLTREVADHAPGYLQESLNLIAEEANAIGFDIMNIPDAHRSMDLEELIQLHCVAG